METKIGVRKRNKIQNEISETKKNQEKIEVEQILLIQGLKEIKTMLGGEEEIKRMLSLFMRSLNIKLPPENLQQQQKEKESVYR